MKSVNPEIQHLNMVLQKNSLKEDERKGKAQGANLLELQKAHPTIEL